MSDLPPSEQSKEPPPLLEYQVREQISNHDVRDAMVGAVLGIMLTILLFVLAGELLKIRMTRAETAVIYIALPLISLAIGIAAIAIYRFRQPEDLFLRGLLLAVAVMTTSFSVIFTIEHFHVILLNL